MGPTLLVAVALLIGVGCADREPAGSSAAAAAAAPATTAATPKADTPALPPHRVFDRPADALAAILAAKPKVIGFGEYHQTVGNEHVPSALQRFTAELLPALGAHATDVVVETWAEYGTCGAAENKVSKDVKRDTERPAQTESEVVGLLRRAKELGMEPHYLPFDCDDYRALLGADGQVDYEKLLQLITERLRTSSIELAAAGKIVAVYGGSTHNDLYPYESVADLSYATAVRDRTDGGYVEVDLYVPEFVAGDELLSKEPWFALLDDVPPGKVALYERDAGSYILLFSKTARGPR